MNGWIALVAVTVFALLQRRQLRNLTWSARLAWVLLGAGAVMAAWSTGGQWWPGLMPLRWLEPPFLAITRLLSGQ
jgi:hypothetical protein